MHAAPGYVVCSAAPVCRQAGLVGGAVMRLGFVRIDRYHDDSIPGTVYLERDWVPTDETNELGGG
jgi:hypothetical protein